MEISEFEGWLKKGLGRAIVFLQNNDAAPYRDVILHACTHDVRHDRQCERRRTAYLVDLIRLTNEPDFYRERILSALQWPDEEQADYQMFELALRFAQAGDNAAKRVMYTTFAKNAAKGDFTGAEELVRLDGFDGFLYAVERLSPIDLEEVGWEVENWIEVLEERYGKEEAWQKLASMAVSMPEIAPLLEHVRQTRQERDIKRKTRSTHRQMDYAAVKRMIVEQGRKVSRGRLWWWGRNASEQDLEQAADDFLREEDAGRLYAYLHIFWKRRFPLEPDRLLILAADEDEATARAALNALSHIKHPSVRKLALELIQEPKWAGWAVDLLSANYADGDIQLIEPFLAAEMEPDYCHWLGMRTTEFLEAHPAADGERALTLLYEKQPCSLCRYSVVKLLANRYIIPDWMREECRYDADPDTREMVSSFKPSGDGGTTSR